MNFDDLLKRASERSANYIRSIAERRVFPTAQAIEALAQLGGDFSEEGLAAESVLALLDDVGSPATVATTGGRYFGFVNGGTLPAALAASWLVSAWDQNVSLRVMSPAGAAFEDVALDWVLDILRLPQTSGGAIVTGATMANFCGLAAARHALLRRAGWDVEEEGLFGAPPLRVVVGDEVHISLLKALAVI